MGVGDFNSLLSPEDKQGGRPFASSSVGALRQFMDQSGLIDLGSLGLPYTWTNCRHGQANIREKLDRGITNVEWRELFPRASVTNLPITSSDHAPLVVDSTGGSRAIASPFRFEEFWVNEPDCYSVILKAWKLVCSGSPALRLCKKLKATKGALKRWNRERVRNVHSNIQNILKELEMVQLLAASDQNSTLEGHLRVALAEEQQKEEWLWRSKLRVQWLTSPDLNTRFFHVSTIVRRRRNAVEFLQDSAGCWIDSRDQIGQLFVDSFSEIFTSSNLVIPLDLAGLILPVISDAENATLIAIPSEGEVWKAVKQIGSRKASGLNGLTALFYKQYWPIVKQDVVDMVQNVFRSEFILSKLNHTNIALIPKVDSGVSLQTHFFVQRFL